MTDRRDDLPIGVLLAPPLAEALGSSMPAGAGRIEAEVSELLDDLGLVRRPVVRVEADDAGGDRLVRLRVDGRPWRFPETVVPEALAYVDGTPRVAVDSASARESLLAPGSAADRPAEVLAVAVRAALSGRPEHLTDPAPVPSAPTIDVHVEPAYLQALLREDPEGGLFSFAREGLFVELGLPLPPFHLRPDASLRPDGFAFRINNVRVGLRIGLATDTILVNDTADRLALMNVAAEPTRNPATNQPAAIVAREHKELLEAAGLTTWEPFGLLILCFAAAVRRNAHALVTGAVAEAPVEQLGVYFPFLGDATRDHIPPEAVADVLRDLLADGIPVRNLRRILELLLRYQTLDAAERGDVERATFVRTGLADAIAFKTSRGTDTVVVYLLAPELEDAVEAYAGSEAATSPAPSLPDRLSAAFAAEIAHLPPTAQRPGVLTRDALRRPIREVLRHEYPEFPVLGYGDLPVDVNLQPVARISWADEG
jgi:type III secretion protein V